VNQNPTIARQKLNVALLLIVVTPQASTTTNYAFMADHPTAAMAEMVWMTATARQQVCYDHRTASCSPDDDTFSSEA
jgi:hypothetical protein